MRILWMCNIPLPRIAEAISIPSSTGGGWLVGLSNDLLLNEQELKLYYCFPVSNSNHNVSGQVENLKYYGFSQKTKETTEYNIRREDYYKSILNEVKPDIVHIWGTEYPHSLAMVNACKDTALKNKVVISIQGLVSIYSIHYMAGIPSYIYWRYTLRDFLRQSNLIKAREKFRKCGQYEIEAIKLVKHVIGRTDWDKACTQQINPEVQYHYCNETLRDEFYEHQWTLSECEHYSIFISQASYPIKGLHIMLEAMPEIIIRFPNTHLYVAGHNIALDETLKDKLKMTYYGKYIRSLIMKYKLEKNITFTGNLDEKTMCKRYLKSHVFVSSSSIENSPNSLGEAMLLGVPCVASCVGGVKDMLKDKEEGFIYPFNEAYMLSYYVCEIFQNDKLALQFSNNARKHAQKTHNKSNNMGKIIDIYKKIIDKGNVNSK